MSTVDTIRAARAAKLAAQKAYDDADRANLYDPERNAAFEAMLAAQTAYYQACDQWKPEDGLVTGCGIHPCIPNPFCDTCCDNEAARVAAGETGTA